MADNVHKVIEPWAQARSHGRSPPNGGRARRHTPQGLARSRGRRAGLGDRKRQSRSLSYEGEGFFQVRRQGRLARPTTTNMDVKSTTRLLRRAFGAALFALTSAESRAAGSPAVADDKRRERREIGRDVGQLIRQTLALQIDAEGVGEAEKDAGTGGVERVVASKHHRDDRESTAPRAGRRRDRDAARGHAERAQRNLGADTQRQGRTTYQQWSSVPSNGQSSIRPSR